MPQKPEQLPFTLAHRDSFTRDDFFASGCNSAALGWVDRWPAWPAPALLLHGPKGCGKTHLAHIWAGKSGAVFLRGAPDLQNAQGAVVIDDADEFCIGNRAAEESLFMLYNRDVPVLLTAGAPPRDWNFVLPDLKSRLLAAPAVAVGLPDDALLSVLLAKMFSDRQLRVAPDVIAFLLPRIERSCPAVHDIAARIDLRALAEKRAVTIPFLREMLNAK
jgi:chromosomal replication initiation ATPase DnaA